MQGGTSSLAAVETVLLDLRQAIQESSAAVSHGNLPDVSMDETHLKQEFQNLLATQ